METLLRDFLLYVIIFITVCVVFKVLGLLHAAALLNNTSWPHPCLSVCFSATFSMGVLNLHDWGVLNLHDWVCSCGAVQHA
jgi:hypothetical protein